MSPAEIRQVGRLLALEYGVEMRMVEPGEIFRTVQSGKDVMVIINYGANMQGRGGGPHEINILGGSIGTQGRSTQVRFQDSLVGGEGKPVPLTTGEFSVLKVLVQHPRTPLSRDKLMELARGREYEVFDRSIDVQISRLRKIVEDDPSRPRHIQTVWGFGYVFVPDGTPK